MAGLAQLHSPSVHKLPHLSVTGRSKKADQLHRLYQFSFSDWLLEMTSSMGPGSAPSTSAFLLQQPVGQGGPGRLDLQQTFIEIPHEPS